MFAFCFLADKMSLPPSTIFRDWSEEDVAFMLAFYKFKADKEIEEARKK